MNGNLTRIKATKLVTDASDLIGRTTLYQNFSSVFLLLRVCNAVEFKEKTVFFQATQFFSSLRAYPHVKPCLRSQICHAFHFIALFSLANCAVVIFFLFSILRNMTCFHRQSPEGYSALS